LTWPKGKTTIPIPTLLIAARRLEHDGRAGKPFNRDVLRRMSRTLDAYVASLPAEQQDEVATRLWAEIEPPPGPEKVVEVPKKSGRRAESA
jgi:hypothetical protein